MVNRILFDSQDSGGGGGGGLKNGLSPPASPRVTEMFQTH